MMWDYLPIQGAIFGNDLGLTQQEADWRREIRPFVLQNPGRIFTNGNSNFAKVALTFDDGPDDLGITDAVSDILRHYQIKGNFFLLGEQIQKYPEIVTKLYTQGHLVLNHATHHTRFESINADIVAREIRICEENIAALIGVQPCFFRPPYGIVTPEVLNAAQLQNVNIVLWSLNTSDWRPGVSSDFIFENVRNFVRRGEIILMHCGRNAREGTVESLPPMIEHLKKRGFQIVGLDELLQQPAYK